MTSAFCIPTAFALATEPPALPASAPLPDAPSALLAKSDDSSKASEVFDQAATSNKGQPMALPRVKFIAAGQPVPPQTAHDKFVLGFRETITPFSMLGWVFSAGWSHLIDGRPNYGTNREAFAQRLGAAAALSASKEIFSDSVLAPVFHQDPRYYQRGKSYKLVNRAIYAATRPVVGRTDSGRTIPNYAHILATGGAAALTQTYYPQRNTTASQVGYIWLTSLGGSAVGYVVSEFGGEVIQWLHIKKTE